MLEVACIQFDPRVGDKTYNVEHSLKLIGEAASQGAKLIVLPELCNSGYVFNDREEAYSLSEPIPEGDTTQAWTEAARKHDVYIAAGINERDNDKLYNSVVLTGPQGYIGTYRKVHLWNKEKLFFEPGDAKNPVFHTPVGRIGILNCYDVWFPESFRTCALNGAEIVAVPTNWVPMPEQKKEDLPMAVHLCMANAHSNGVFVAAADRIGTERGQSFLGHSVIIEPSGRPISGPASQDQEEIVYGSCDLSKATLSRTVSERNHVLHDRREELYEL
ncbi:nitrilase family protein [Alteribacillus iranensis]|uniref:Predicted amidohydrolase n=1 Tax=Alteribacillus iranensis TaxID=930128 RepID=A0A1I2BIY3_9BACI|nr:nitrilase family protein [Alteribacillus iranensis]SFE56019.1 Predicted amidohydrolase [Alteribacillus iranensis]